MLLVIRLLLCRFPSLFPHFHHVPSFISVQSTSDRAQLLKNAGPAGFTATDSAAAATGGPAVMVDMSSAPSDENAVTALLRQSR
jgi:hypothetical protein